ncbi:hypothetical protein KSS87_016006 [Heliosperma pusillum]|nr:hypothetical protein KSS87_016006 [Heliosperma pusillum]
MACKQIVRAEDPGGPKINYLFRLEKALLELGYPKILCAEEITSLSRGMREFFIYQNIWRALKSLILFCIRFAFLFCDRLSCIYFFTPIM